MKNELHALKKLQGPEITTRMLLGVLSNYVDARGKINALSKKKLIEPIKQGVYLLSEDISTRPFSKDILANIIYGPSYVSLETALSFYGFIPEQVLSITSICFGRGKNFSTPVGEFKYHHIKSSIYPLGVQIKEVFQQAYCLYASPEKALLDFIHIKESKGEFKNQKDFFDYIVDSYRLDLQAIERNITLKKMQIFAEQYSFNPVRWFSNELITRLIK